MKLGTRITLTTTTLVAVALGVYGAVSVRNRRAELTADLERQTQLTGSTLRVALEAALQEGLFEDVRKLVARLQAASPPVQIIYWELPDPTAARPAAAAPASAPAPAPTMNAPQEDTAAEEDDDEPETPWSPPPPDPARDERIRRVLIDGEPYGEHLERDGRPLYAWTVPLRDKRKKVVAAIDLLRDESDIEDALGATVRQVAVAVVLAGVGLALLVLLTTRRALSHPLQRLVEGIDEVTVGDLTRVILREREDEIGGLADRFNQMTTSLREARAETQRGIEAKLALEARLRQSEKLATIGQIAAGIAHEVGTPLNVIAGRARAMEKKAARAVEAAERAAAEAEALAREMFAAREQSEAGSELESGSGLGSDRGSNQATPMAAASMTAATSPSGRESSGLSPLPLDPADVAKNAGIIAAQAARITGIIQQLLEYARKRTPSRAPVDLARVARDTVDFLEHQLGQHQVEAVVMPFLPEPGTDAPSQPVVLGDAEELQQVALNLCVNAIQAMPRGGRLEVGCSSLVRRKRGLETAPPNRYVVLDVSDTGVGITAAERERIFEPFYSTKQAAGGTGLGLAVSQGIVKDHDGWIEVESRPEGGTRFRVFLPAAEEAAA